MTYNLNLSLNAAIFLSHMPQRELLQAANGYKYEKNKMLKEQESFVMGWLKNWCRSLKLESWVSTWVLLSWVVCEQESTNEIEGIDVCLLVCWLNIFWEQRLLMIEQHELVDSKHYQPVNISNTLTDQKWLAFVNSRKNNLEKKSYKYTTINC